VKSNKAEDKWTWNCRQNQSQPEDMKSGQPQERIVYSHRKGTEQRQNRITHHYSRGTKWRPKRREEKSRQIVQYRWKWSTCIGEKPS
jgi:hypothetical protein